MKKYRIKRFGFGVLQHVIAAFVFVMIAGLLLNSYVEVESIDGKKVYKIFPLNTDVEFEESEIFRDLYRNAVSDITQLVAIKNQVETEGVFDPSKKINVTEYAIKTDVDKGCNTTAIYELEDMIKWGKYGVEYTDRIMSMSEFVNYFGYCIYPENFALDEQGQLYFEDFYLVDGRDTLAQRRVETAEDGEEATLYNKMKEELEAVAGEFKKYTEEQLEDFVFSHIIAQNLEEVKLSREDNGDLNVYLPMLNCRYSTVSGIRQITEIADNWIDYIRLQNNLVATIEKLTDSYQRYQDCNEAYSDKNSNVKYMIRMTTNSGVETYTNVPEVKTYSDNDVTEFFTEYRRYLIYYPDSLVFMGNTLLGEEELDGYISIYDYAYPDTTHIWLGVDTNYANEGDAFFEASQIYKQIVPNVNRMLTMIAVLVGIWLITGIYLTITAGNVVAEDGSVTCYLNRFDRVWTEFFAGVVIFFVFGGIFGYRIIMDITKAAGVETSQLLGIQLTKIYRYGIFAIYGIYLSLAFDIVWYSFVRRMKAANLWTDSFLYHLLMAISKTCRFVARHRNSAVSTLIPYNLFLFTNLVGIIMVYTMKDTHRLYAGLILFAMVVMDVIVGILVFRNRAEQIEIVEGINKIRDGEVDFHLDGESLHGSNREMADAVNNIGEGIRKAVRTSMKDEQMKTDLITNVSHDIKTPLTSIINYVDLLKRLKIQEEPAKGYINILDSKAQRLKQLTDDLVEASKISSGNIILEMAKLNLTELIHQSMGEFSEKMEESRLQMIFADGDEPAYIYADSRRMWRVMENLFNNVCKYAMEGTRVYIDLENSDGQISVSVKNISKMQMNIRPDELTERFIRGDSSRSTEGSGLGLSIAKSLVQAQGGTFEIVLDGDLFKIVVSFSEYVEPIEDANAQDNETGNGEIG